MGFCHIIRQDDLLRQCMYCGSDVTKNHWDTVFCGNSHYKTTNCSCGKEVFVKVDFLGSGHDDFNEEKGLEFRIDMFRFDRNFF